MKFDLVRYLAGECRRDPVQTVTLSEISRVLREADPTLTRDVVALLICVPQIRHQLRDRHNLSSVVLDRVNDLVGGLKILREYRGWMGNGHYNIIAPAEVQQFLRRAGVKIGATIYDTRPDPAIEKLQGTVLNVIDKRPFVHVSKTTKLPHWTRVGRYYGKRTSEQRYTLISSVVFTLADGTNLSLI
jgi:hypothetical protein